MCLKIPLKWNETPKQISLLPKIFSPLLYHFKFGGVSKGAHLLRTIHIYLLIIIRHHGASTTKIEMMEGKNVNYISPK